ncbi:MAG: hypothetical protein B6U72_07385 [Candidatus Altiarchaeales archaeon ex4484_2]|nr:MAG: hypothetical protein B6U72_07385 [Candidatus Altiarchaeales archaeon ex4484_2]
MLTGWLCGDKPIIIVMISSLLSIIASVSCLKKHSKKSIKIFYYLVPIVSIILFPILVSIFADYAKLEYSILNKTWPFIWMNAFWIAQIAAASFTFKETEKSK